MNALGYSEGRDYLTEHRSAQVELTRLPTLAAELVTLNVNLIVSSSTPTTLAASKSTREIPILFVTVGDPVGSGLAASLARPGGNITGLTSLTSELVTKRLDLLHQLLPQMRRVGLLYNPDNQVNARELTRFESDCGKLKLTPVRVPARKTEDIAAGFTTLTKQKAQGLIVTGGGTTYTSRNIIVEHAAKHHLPVVYPRSGYADVGGLIAYAPDYSDMYRRAAAYADKIFKGAKPGELPIEQPTNFELVVNLKTAKALGVKISQSILVQATKVIE